MLGRFSLILGTGNTPPAAAATVAVTAAAEGAHGVAGAAAAVVSVAAGATGVHGATGDATANIAVTVAVLGTSEPAPAPRRVHGGGGGPVRRTPRRRRLDLLEELRQLQPDRPELPAIVGTAPATIEVTAAATGVHGTTGTAAATIAVKAAAIGAAPAPRWDPATGRKLTSDELLTAWHEERRRRRNQALAALLFAA